MKHIWYSLILIASIPLLTLAIEPASPSGYCERFIGEKDIQSCKERTEKEDVDWYAGAVCNLQKDDAAFWICWDSVKGKSFNPQALEKCGEDKDLSDEQRQSCVNDAKGARKPASDDNDLFQKLKFKGRH
ncbi:hypothetical protein [Bdellovibrio sp. BCCA]|uniref:hypothetical protein n=1 Tax=Bdellovibrio sp. BCCA TaxID=3136281 RepID=UPI0030F15F63